MIRSLALPQARNRRLQMLLALPALAAATAVLAACGSSGTPSGTSSGGGSSAHAVAAGGGLKTAKIGSVTVLTSAKGFTLYSFAPDTPTKSNCNGACAKFWPPVKGAVSASGVKGTFGTIKRSNGSVAGHLRRAPAVHLRRRHRSRAGQGQRPEPLRRGVARSHHLRQRPRRQLVIGLRWRRLRVLRTD